MDTLLEALTASHQLAVTDAEMVQGIHADTGVAIDQILVQNGLIDNDKMAAALHKDAPLVLSPELFVPDIESLSLVPESVARTHAVLPLTIDEEKKRLIFATSKQPALPQRDVFAALLPVSLTAHWVQADATDLMRCLDIAYGVSWQLDAILDELDRQACEEGGHVQRSDLVNVSPTPDQDLARPALPPPAVRLVDALLHDACSRRASDIHLCPEAHLVRIRYRVDGVLMTARCLARRYWPALVVRLKVLAKLDIAESRLPQDGHLSRQMHGRLMDFRMASFPVQQGENLVLRVLDRTRYLRSLDSLKLASRAAESLRAALHQPHGMIVVCGPTGSGKTTTLYALLQELDAMRLNIMTLEDPVEYPLPHIRQTAVGKVPGFDYAAGVRGVLRQDPDVLLIGEIRDANSCHMAMRAVMSGHQVLTTVHAHDVFGAIQRLQELGADRAVLASNLTAVVAQRLIRRRCPVCSEGRETTDTDTHAICSLCEGTGHYERMALLEQLMVNADVRSAIAGSDDVDDWFACAARQGFQCFDELGALAVEHGDTTQTEVHRVLGR